MRFCLVIFLLSYLSFANVYGAKSRSSHFSEKSLTPWGADAELANQPLKPKNPESYSLGSKTCQSMIRFFQIYISPIDGPRSSFLPTSSQYTLLAIQKHGVFKGIAMGCDRLMRENNDPWVYRTIPFNGTERKHDVPK